MARTTYKLLGLRPDTDYRLQLRAKVNGTTGAWSSSFDFSTTLDTVPPGPVTNLFAQYVDGAITLTWEPPLLNADGSDFTDFSYYKIYATDQSTGNEQEFTSREPTVTFTLQNLRFLFGLELSGDYNFEVTVFDRAGNESIKSGVTFTAAPPQPFNMLAFESLNQAIRVSWEEAVDDDLVYYEIYRDSVLVGRTVGTELQFTDGNPGGGSYSYYAIAYDAFGLNTQSTNTLTGAKAFGYWQGDVSVPKPPTNITFSSQLASADGSRADVTVSFDAPVQNVGNSDYEDHNEFVLEWSSSASGPWQSSKLPDTRLLGVDAQSFSAGVNGLNSGTLYYFRIAAIDRYSNQSAWATAEHNTPVDVGNPSQPAAPTAAASLLRIQVTHSLNKQAGGKLESDVRELKVYVGTNAGFTPNSSNYVGSISTIDPLTGFTPTASFAVELVTFRWVKVIAVDASGNESAPSLATDASQIGLVTDAFIENASITNASIASLSASKLIAGTAFVNDLKVQSKLTVETNGGNVGVIESSNYVANLTGWRLSDSGLELNTGTVAATALTINNSRNMLNFDTATFEQEGKFLFGGTDAAGNAVTGKFSRNARAAASTIAVKAWEGETSLRFQTDSSTGVGDKAEVLFAESTVAETITGIEAGERYVYSFYAYSEGAGSYVLEPFMTWAPGATAETSGSVVVSPGSQRWRRYSYIFTAPSGATTANLGIRMAQANVSDLYIDGQQLELVTSAAADALITPSAWKAPSLTSIDGGFIRTGEIKSTNYAQSGGIPTAGWRIGMEGNASFRNIFARGTIQADAGYLQNMSVYNTLTVGNAANDTTSLIKSFNGNWSIRGDGYLYAANASIYGNINATSGTFSGITAYSITVGTPGLLGLIKSSNYTGQGGAGWFIDNLGNSVFNNIYARGNIQASSIEANVSMTSPLIYGGLIEVGTFQTDFNSTYGRIHITSTGGINFHRSTIGTPVGRLYADSAGLMHIQGGSGLFIESSGIIYIDSQVDIGGYGIQNLGLSSVSGIGMTSSSGGTGGINAQGHYLRNIGRINSNTTYLEIDDPISMNGNNIHSAGIYYGVTLSLQNGGTVKGIGSETYFGDSSCGILTNGTAMHVVNSSNTVYQTLRAIIADQSSMDSKKDIVTAESVLERIQQLRIVEFKFKQQDFARLGVIAEEVQQVDDRLSQDGGVSPTGLAAYALAGIQELTRRIEELEARLQ